MPLRVLSPRQRVLVVAGAALLLPVTVALAVQAANAGRERREAVERQAFDAARKIVLLADARAEADLSWSAGATHSRRRRTAQHGGTPPPLSPHMKAGETSLSTAAMANLCLSLAKESRRRRPSALALTVTPATCSATGRDVLACDCMRPPRGAQDIRWR